MAALAFRPLSLQNSPQQLGWCPLARALPYFRGGKCTGLRFMQLSRGQCLVIMGTVFPCSPQLGRAVLVLLSLLVKGLESSWAFLKQR